METDNSEPDPTHTAWAVYRRKTRKGRRNLFWLATVCLKRETAIQQALDLLQQDGPGYEYCVRGDHGQLPEKLTGE
jgi:hypothetical protein